MATVCVITVVSFIYCLMETEANPAVAYFSTPVRAWEFGVGGLLALVLPRARGPRALRAAMSWLGIATILGSAWFFTTTLDFPGWIAAIPVAGTLLVIAAGDLKVWWSPSIILNRRPVQFIGDISYSVYLWHWPLIVFIPIIFGGLSSLLTLPQAVAVVVLTFGLSWGTKVFVEDRFRQPRRAQVTTLSTRKLFIFAASGALVVALFGGVIFNVSAGWIATATQQMAKFEAKPPHCFGAMTLSGVPVDCAGSSGSPTLVPPAILAMHDSPTNGCQQRLDRPSLITCQFGTPDDGKHRRVAVIGDSHSNQWMAAIIPLAKKSAWAVTTYFKSSCPYSAATYASPSCASWNSALRSALLAHPYDVVITSAAWVPKTIKSPSQLAFSRAVNGYQQAWNELIAAGSSVVVIANTPNPGIAGIASPPTCVDTKPVTDCDFTPAAGLPRDPLVEAAGAMKNPSSHLLDFTSDFCLPSVCPAVIGNVLVYKDNNHMTSTYSTSLAPALNEKLQPIIRKLPRANS